MSVKTYTVSFDTAAGSMSRRNDGFNPFELVGIVRMIEKDLLDQLNGKSDAAIAVKKEYVEQDKEEESCEQ